MATKKYLSLDGLTEYDALIKARIDASSNAVKNDLLNGAGTAYDTLKELGDLIDDNQDAIGALETVAAGKADKEHNHDDKYYTESEIDSKLEAKANAASVPTKTSQLTNDSGYITEETITAISTAEIDEICGASIVAASEVTF